MITLNKVQGSEPLKYAIVSDRCGYVEFNNDNSDFSIFMLDKRVPTSKLIDEINKCVVELKQRNFPDIYNFKG